MARTCKTPPGDGGASRDLLGGWSRFPDTLSGHRAQHIAARYALPIELAATVAALCWGAGS